MKVIDHSSRKEIHYEDETGHRGGCFPRIRRCRALASACRLGGGSSRRQRANGGGATRLAADAVVQFKKAVPDCVVLP